MENPWLGLKTYEEGQILFGRNEEIEILSNNIINNVQTIIYGKSGIGKSSILQAGIFPIVRKQHLFPVNIRLVHNATPYNEQIIRHIGDSLAALRKETLDENGKKKEIFTKGSIKELVPPVRADESLWEYFHRCKFYDETGTRIFPMIVFDQFEEIFTLEKDSRKVSGFFSELADLLNNVTPDYILNAGTAISETFASQESNGELSIEDLLAGVVSSPMSEYLQDAEFHVVLSLREDFLSYLERNIGNIPCLKQNRYCLQPIDDEQAGIIIMNPAPGLVSKEVAELILQKITDNPNVKLDGKRDTFVDSAILSLFLAELFKKKPENEQCITAELVNKFGGNIISSFYEESMGKISEESAAYLENSLLNEEGRRENISIYKAKQHVKGEELETLKELRLIHEFAWGDTLRIEFIHDILCKVAFERRQKRLLLKQEAEERKRAEEAQRRILEEEKRKRQEIERKAQIEKEKAQKRLRNVIFAIGAVVVLWFAWWLCWKAPYSVCYASFAKQNGWPVGVGEALDEDDMKDMVICYRLTRKGWLGLGFEKPFHRVDVLDASGQPVENRFLSSPMAGIDEENGSDEQASAFAKMQRKVAYWLFEADNSGKYAAREIAYASDGSPLFTLSYFWDVNQNGSDTQGAERQATQMWGVYMDRNGKPMRVRDNGCDRMRIVLDSVGNFSRFLFYSETGTPHTDRNGAFGYGYSYDAGNRLTRRAVLNEFGDETGTTVDFSDFDRFGRWQKRMVEETVATAEYHPGMVAYANGQLMETHTFDHVGNTIGIRTSDLQGNPANGRNGYSRIDKKYNNAGLVSEYRYRIVKGKESLIYAKNILFDASGRIASETTSDGYGKGIRYVRKRYEYVGNRKITTYYGGQHPSDIDKPIVYKDYHKEIEISYPADSVTGERMVETAYYNTNKELFGNGDYAKVQTVYDKNGNIAKEVNFYEDETIQTSYLYYYDSSGTLIAQSVMGIDGTPIRYAAHERQGLCYYQLKFVRDFKGQFVAVRGINEFGDSCIVSTSDGKGISIYPLQSVNNANVKGYMYVAEARQTEEDLHNCKVAYLRIKDADGLAHKVGLRDGDIVVRIGGFRLLPSRTMEANQLKAAWTAAQQTGAAFVVVRHHPATKASEVLHFTLPAGDFAAEIYPVYYTEKERTHILTTLNNAKL